MIGIDTFSWTKLFRLMDAGWEDILLELLGRVQAFITPDVEKELQHFHLKKKNLWEKFPNLQRKNRTFDHYIQKNFDEADASLLEYSELEQYTIVTEDGPMLAQNTTNRDNIIQLGDFFRRYYEIGFFTAKELRQLIKWLRKSRNLTKRNEKRLLSI